jgi:hypothetical protein
MRPAPIESHAVTVTEILLEQLGPETARKLADVFGGRRLYVPKAMGEHHPIVQTIGPQAAAVLAEHFGGAAGIDVPMLAERRARILELDAAGWSRARIARDVGCTERRVYQVLEQARRVADRPPPRQGSLF